MKKNDNILVMGGTGFVGRVLVRLFTERIPAAHIVATYNSQKPRFKKSNLSWVKFDLTNIKKSSLNRFVFNAVIHTAAFLPPAGSQPDDWAQKIFDVNVFGTIKLFDYIRLDKNAHIIFISSAAVYKQSRKRFKEDATINPPHVGKAYGYSKILCEWYLGKKFKQLAVVRPSYIYGRGMDKKKLMPRLIMQCSRGKTLSLQPPFTSRCDYVHVNDVVSGVYKIFKKKAKGIYNLGSGQGVSIKEVARYCIDAAGRGRFPHTHKKNHLPVKKQLLVNIGKARSQLQWSPQISLFDGLKDLSAWLQGAKEDG